ncbi:MAG: GNAT family N-acetyltransferase [Deltaproteobacteria bacterium]|jgi:ribosomal-protein-alanine acetyltransferase|nr:GNAT family N-acetyltransferase [Deltaproteobacteria bacterium]
MNERRLRILAPEDLPGVLDIERASFPDEPWTLENFLDEMDRPYSVGLGLFEGGTDRAACPPGASAPPASRTSPEAGPLSPRAGRAAPVPQEEGHGDASAREAALALAEILACASRAGPDRPIRLSRLLAAQAASLRGRAGVARPQVSAYAVFWLLYEETHLLNLAVAPERRGRGLGREMLRAVRAISRAKGSETILLEVKEDNLAALSLYRSEGFRATGRRRGYYQGGRTDAILMNLELGPARPGRRDR